MQRLAAYERWHRKSARTTTDTKLYLPEWNSGPLLLGGYLDRIDVLLSPAQSMQGIFLGRHTGRWREELRMPLAQHALSTFLCWPPDEVAVGVQLIDGSEPEVQHYSSFEVREALNEFAELQIRVAALLDSQ